MTKQLLFLGSGAAFTIENYHSNILLTTESGRLLIDCGTDIRRSLALQGLTYNDISDVYISHLHADHAGGLEWLGFTHYNNHASEAKRPNLYISKKLVTPLWNNKLKGGMDCLANVKASLKTFFNVHVVKFDNFVWGNIVFELVQTIHTYSKNTLNPSYGLFFELNGTKIFITGDTQFSPNVLMHFYEKADIIFQDCETAENNSTVHARFDELNTLPAHFKKKMWLYHYNDGPKKDAKAAGFLGYVPKGAVFEF
jgi:ribonuclease BN (tRNA processing enzyme)